MEQTKVFLSPEEVRAAYSVTDILTTLNLRTNHPPTPSLICRKLDSLSRPAFDSLSIMIAAKANIEDGVRLSSHQINGVARAVSSCFQADAASEIAHVHACGGVVSAAAAKAAYYEYSHVLRIGLQHFALTRKIGIPLRPIATDMHARAIAALTKGEGGNMKAALGILGVADTLVLEEGFFASATGLLTGCAFCVAVMDRLDPGEICCGTCCRVVSGEELTICGRCGDHLACEQCMVGEGKVQHMNECRRVRDQVRAMAQTLVPHIRESARRVAVVRLSDSGLIAPTHVTSIASALIPSSLWEYLSRCSTSVTHSEISTYWRLLIVFLAEPDGDDQEAIEYQRVYVDAAEYAAVADKQQLGPTRRAPLLSPSEQRRLRKGVRATKKRAEDEVRAATVAKAEAEAVVKANNVLERQVARLDATSAMLTSVLAKRESAASPEVVARVRVRRDSLKAAERRAQRPFKARPARSPSKMVHENVVFASARLAAAGLLQRYARVWLRRRKKLRRKERSRAAKSLQRSVRAWLLPRVVASATSSVATAAAPGYNEDDVLCVVCIERPRVMLFLGCAHLCACEDCASILVACPLCRAVGVKMRVYM